SEAAPAPQAPPGERVSLPDDVIPDELTPERVAQLFTAPQGDRELGADPETGEPVVLKSGRYGPYVNSGERSSSLFSTMDPQEVTLTQALRLLSLPRVIGAIDGDEVTAQHGRYGPYVKKGTDSRSLENEAQLFSVNLEQAQQLFSQPKTRTRKAPAAPLRELGEDPVSKQPVVVKDGRFGPYVTDGESNASLRKGDSVEEITIERAAELLADRRERAPVKRTRKPKKATT
ncbi:MAG: topoisomerase C-terminal repeat-containing protein, partial [Mycobacteriales bacterium]